MQRRDVLVVGATLAGAAAALAAVRSGARTRLLVSAAPAPAEVPPIPVDPTDAIEPATADADLALPAEPQVFRFRARRVRRWLDELDVENDEGWATNLHGAILDRLEREGCAVDEHAVATRLVRTDEGGVAGAVLVDGSDCEVHQADTTVLAGGGARFLWPTDQRQAPPTGLALAVRARLPLAGLGQVAWSDHAAIRFIGGVEGNGKGRCGVPGVAACGEALASPLHAVPELAHVEDVVRGLEAGGFQGAAAGEGSPEMVPVVDDPMPPGFAQVKLARLRGLMEKRVGPEASPEDLETAHAELLSLRGEFADYARARADTQVHVLHQAADVALAHVATRLGQAPPST